MRVVETITSCVFTAWRVSHKAIGHRIRFQCSNNDLFDAIGLIYCCQAINKDDLCARLPCRCANSIHYSVELYLLISGNFLSRSGYICPVLAINVRVAAKQLTSNRNQTQNKTFLCDVCSIIIWLNSESHEMSVCPISKTRLRKEESFYVLVIPYLTLIAQSPGTVYPLSDCNRIPTGTERLSNADDTVIDILR